MMIQAGKLRHLVTVQTYTTTQDAYGQQIRAWSTFRQVWSQIIRRGGREIEQEGKIRNFARLTLRIRHLPSLTPDMRVQDGSALYNIISIDPDPTLQRHDLLTCEVSANV